MPNLPEAVELKYGEPFFDMQLIDVACVTLSLRGCGRFRPPSVLILAGCDIEEAGDEEELRSQCEGVTELDLSKNKFKKWEEVFKILQFVPALTFLNLSYNSFENSVRCPTYGLSHLSRLILNGTGLPWKDVHSLLSLTPSLEELHLCLNGYSTVDKSPSAYKTVKRIHFNCNPVKDWKQIEQLGLAFPSLEILILADCPIESLSKDCSYSNVFPRLKYLSLNNSKISSWDSVDLINKFPILKELRLHQCPLFQQYSDDERRKLSISRLAFIERLNGGANISPEEREDAERGFIRYYLNVSEEERPNRYNELVTKHGHLDPLVNVSLKPKKSVQVTIVYGDIKVNRTLSVYMKVADVKRTLEPEFGIPSSRMRLFYVDKANGASYAPDELKINTKQLYTLNMNSGDEFIVDLK
ncbi:UNVERIFIED_CONTAM: hypothetical protein RMT77_008224 [Armadillidium vulgare]